MRTPLAILALIAATFAVPTIAFAAGPTVERSTVQFSDPELVFASCDGYDLLSPDVLIGRTVVVRGVYEALDRGDMAGFAAAFAPDAVLHGGEGVEIAGAESIARMIWQLRDMTNGTLRWGLHDVLANSQAVHTVRSCREVRAARREVIDDRPRTARVSGLIPSASFGGEA